MYCLLLIIIFLSSSYVAEAIEYQKVSNLAESIEESMKQFSLWQASVKMDYSRIKIGEKSKIINDSSFLVFQNSSSSSATYFVKGEKIRRDVRLVFNVNNFSVVTERKSSFNGEKTMIYKVTQNYPKLIAKPKASIISGNGTGSEDNPVYNSYTVIAKSWDAEFQCCYPITEYINGGTSAGKVEFFGDEVLDGLNCLVFSSEVINGVSSKIWISPERMYCLIKAEVYTPNERIIIKNTFTQSGELWYLKERVLDSYYKENGDKLQTLTLVTNKFSHGEDINDNMFELDFPKGINVLRFDENARIPAKNIE